MTMPSVAEILLVITTLSSSAKWWVDRRDARSTLATAKSDAEKTVTSLREALDAEKATSAAKDDLIEHWQQRAMHAETLLFSREAR